ncbi:hypothetical protein [Laribacter hongkongensis]|uniref:hypothetical protein n=1 Tax=Laribacter hongkongensis TaxID=168471 RepID=UPI001D0C0C68|nr:hypothetical protein [Laribacter hongkongensis]
MLRQTKKRAFPFGDARFLHFMTKQSKAGEAYFFCLAAGLPAGVFLTLLVLACVRLALPAGWATGFFGEAALALRVDFSAVACFLLVRAEVVLRVTAGLPALLLRAVTALPERTDCLADLALAVRGFFCTPAFLACLLFATGREAVLRFSALGAGAGAGRADRAGLVCAGM